MDLQEKKTMYAPKIDTVIEHIGNGQMMSDEGIRKKLMEIYQALEPVKISGDDYNRMIWIEVPRGNIGDFGTFEEYRDDGWVETREGFNQLWLDYYPDETKWYSFATAKYQQQRFFYFSSKLIFTLDEKEDYPSNKSYPPPEILHFLEWLPGTVKQAVGELIRDTAAYNQYLEKNLSYDKRVGRINRMDFWKLQGKDARRLDKKLGRAIIGKLADYINQSKKKTYDCTLPHMTANDFYGYCDICYTANDYFKKENKDLTPKEKYLAMADGRDDGLRDIDANSAEAFKEWYHGGGCMGGHPWEICRGGNSTHISLYVSNKKSGWQLYLAGSSVARVEENVRMAVALFENSIPFKLRDAEEILRMITGKDYIGIVPDHVTPRYCGGFFPKDDRIIDFMNLGWDYKSQIIEKAFWYPLDKIELQ